MNSSRGVGAGSPVPLESPGRNSERAFPFHSTDRDHAVRCGLTVAQAYSLDIPVSTGGQSLTGLAGALRPDKSTTGRIVTGMSRSGLVDWSRPAHDQRAKLIVASKEEKLRCGRRRRAIVRDHARLLGSYPPAACKAAITILRQLVQRAEPGPDRP